MWILRLVRSNYGYASFGLMKSQSTYWMFENKTANLLSDGPVCSCRSYRRNFQSIRVSVSHIYSYIYIYILFACESTAPVQLNQSHSAVAIFMFPFSWMHCGYVVSKEEDENDFLPTYKALIGRLLLHSHQKQHQWHHSTRPIWIRVSFSHESHATCRGIHDFIRANFAVGHI